MNVYLYRGAHVVRILVAYPGLTAQFLPEFPAWIVWGDVSISSELLERLPCN